MQRRISFEDKNLVQRGFTLVELLVVIVILGILAAVVVFAVSGITNKGKSSVCTIEVRTVNVALQAAYAENGAYVAGPSVPLMFSQLVSGGFLQAGGGPASAFTPVYVPATGTYSASCPTTG